MWVQAEGLTNQDYAMPAQGMGFGSGEEASLAFIELVEDLFFLLEVVYHALCRLWERDCWHKIYKIITYYLHAPKTPIRGLRGQPIASTDFIP